MKRLLSISLCLALSTLGIQAQGPNKSGTYYKNANGKSGAELKTALHNIISKKTKNLSYSELLYMYPSTDTRSDGYVRDWYSNATKFTHLDESCGNYSQEGDCYNREHTVPQSWGAPKADIVHVVPTDGYVNNRRGNLPFGEVGTVKFKSKNNYSKMGTCKTAGYSGQVFEPNDEVKGDIARIYFYMTTCYEGSCQNWGNGVFTGSKYQPLAKWTYDMMVRWSKLDPVDEIEIARNNAIAQPDVQGNRNPFVDYPGLEDYIWGDKKEVPFSYDNYGNDDIGITERVEQPVFTPEGGTFTDSVEVTITTGTKGATIYYTTDGTDASTNSNVYSEPLKLTRNTTLNAIAAKDSMATSYQQTATYVIKSGQPGNDATSIDIALNNSLFGTSYNGTVSGGNFTGIKEGITVTYSIGSGSNQYINDAQIRIYDGNTLTISSDDGDICDIEFTQVGGKGKKVLQASEGSITGLTWTGVAPSIVFSVNSGSGHIQLSKVTVKKVIYTPELLVGDVNGDGSIDVADIAAVISVMAGAIVPDASPSGNPDVNGDGTVDVADISTIISIMAGNGQSSMVNGQSSMVNGQTSMVNGQSSMVNGQSSMAGGTNPIGRARRLF